jgi:hypothetical protein
MDIPEFEDLLGRLGEDISAWPADRRDQAIALLKSSEQARAALADAQLLRSKLQVAPIRAPVGLLDRIMQKVQQSEAAPLNKPTARKDDK